MSTKKKRKQSAQVLKALKAAKAVIESGGTSYISSFGRQKAIDALAKVNDAIEIMEKEVPHGDN